MANKIAEPFRQSFERKINLSELLIEYWFSPTDNTEARNTGTSPNVIAILRYSPT